MTKTKCKYMHTMDGRPATHYPIFNRLIFEHDIDLVDDLRTIRKQQDNQRAIWVFEGTPEKYKLGYIRVRVDQ